MPEIQYPQGFPRFSPQLRTLNEARKITGRWLAEYNSERPHESLNNLTPEEYRLMAENPEVSKSAWN
ncbi:hypothetical protein NG99_08030 [Erwinia typographi]|uniref:Integrase catalytic domain-containing protein n=1 Tax=Erwinia typographi TaxID=371042 RepID=A0A0A4A9P8_9GAMM|nr:hypothetical protein NG99_08030 [Erwinia typographi]